MNPLSLCQQLQLDDGPYELSRFTDSFEVSWEIQGRERARRMEKLDVELKFTQSR